MCVSTVYVVTGVCVWGCLPIYVSIRLEVDNMCPVSLRFDPPRHHIPHRVRMQVGDQPGPWMLLSLHPSPSPCVSDVWDHAELFMQAILSSEASLQSSLLFLCVLYAWCVYVCGAHTSVLAHLPARAGVRVWQNDKYLPLLLPASLSWCRVSQWTGSLPIQWRGCSQLHPSMVYSSHAWLGLQAHVALPKFYGSAGD